MMLFLGAEQPLPPVAWNEAAPGFHVKDLDPSYDAVRKQLPALHVYYAGSHQGCGCGFQLGHGEYAHAEDVETPARRASLRQLADYVEVQVARGNRLQFFACWAGDEGSPPEHRRVVSVGELRSAAFWFLEKEASSFVAP